mmetsp:Transcript_30359/g.68454  ORF Transcript_30359/g.68454 Transcript_30359/m.68454 type:complete len:298 (-) Transcript_30359:98-991(-)
MRNMLAVAVLSSFLTFGSVGAFQSARSIAKIQHQEWIGRVYSLPDDDGAPSDYDADDLSMGKHVEVDENESDSIIRDELKRELILLASTTNRGQCATLEEQNLVIDLVTQLEALNPTADPALNSQGDWELCYSSTQSFRSSPFFLAIRAFLGDDNKEVAENAFSIHDMATTASRVGKVRQIIDPYNTELISEYDLSVGVAPGLPVRVKGCVVTSADLSVSAPETWEMKVRGTRVKSSNVPFIDEWLDDSQVEVPVGRVYEAINGGDVPAAILKTYYVDEGMRISRDADENFFVFTRA